MAEKEKTIYSALSAFQQEVPVIYKGTTGYGYTYASLKEIFEIINPLLAKHRLGFTQPLNGTSLRTILFHLDTNDIIESSIEIPQNVSLAKMNDFQVLGSAITYMRRYSLASVLGLITDDDTDAAGEQQPAKSSSKKDKEKVTDSVSEEVNEIVETIKSAETVEQLKDMKDPIKKSGISKEDLDYVKQEFNIKMKQLKASEGK